jgi:hypothetical protein
VTDHEKIFLLRSALKAALHRLEQLHQHIRDHGENNNPNVRVIVQAYAALRETQPTYEPVPTANRQDP